MERQGNTYLNILYEHSPSHSPLHTFCPLKRIMLNGIHGDWRL